MDWLLIAVLILQALFFAGSLALLWWVRRCQPAVPPPPPAQVVPTVYSDDRTVMELCNPSGAVESTRTIVGPPPDRFVRPHGRSKAVVYQRGARTGERTWRYTRAR